MGTYSEGVRQALWHHHHNRSGFKVVSKSAAYKQDYLTSQASCPETLTLTLTLTLALTPTLTFTLTLNLHPQPHPNSNRLT